MNFFKFFIRISIHALREESDADVIQAIQQIQEFQSTLSVRRATGRDVISAITIYDFNPRSP